MTDSAVALVYGKVPHPAYARNIIPAFAGQAASYLGPRSNKGVVWHRVVGGMRGTIQHFNLPGTGLTDYLIGNAHVDGDALDGVIWMLNDPLGSRSGWASGSVIQPWGDGKAFLAEYGVVAVNRDQISIELSGFYGTPLTPKQRAALVALTAYYADQAGIPWHMFPKWLNHGYSFVRYHQEYTGPQEKVCPGEVVIAETATLIELVQAVMRQYQQPVVAGGPVIVVPKPVIYAAPLVPDWLKADLQAGVMRDHDWHGIKVWGAEREYTVLERTARHQVASIGSKAIVGPALEPRARFEATHLWGDPDEGWVMTPFGTRVYRKHLSPRIEIGARAR